MNEKEKTAGIVRFDLEVLSDLLDLPEGYQVVRAVCPSNQYNTDPTIALVIEGPLMPHVKLGYEIPTLMAWIDTIAGTWSFKAAGSDETLFTLKRRPHPLRKELDKIRKAVRAAGQRSDLSPCPCCGAKGIGVPHKKDCFLLKINAIFGEVEEKS